MSQKRHSLKKHSLKKRSLKRCSQKRRSQKRQQVIERRHQKVNGIIFRAPFLRAPFLSTADKTCTQQNLDIKQIVHYKLKTRQIVDMTSNKIMSQRIYISILQKYNKQ